MSSKWPPCIVTVFDLVGIKSLAAEGKASTQMIQMRNFAVGAINDGLESVSHGYIWNDSVMMVSADVSAQARLNLLKELSVFRVKLSQHCQLPVFAIAVQGLAFPPDAYAPVIQDGPIWGQPRAVVLETSSWAMANCFLIEKEMRQYRADWYLDSRVTAGLSLKRPFEVQNVNLLPKFNESREVQMFIGNFH